MKTRQQRAKEARLTEAREQHALREAEEQQARACFLEEAPARLQRILGGELPGQQVLAAILLRAAEEAYQQQVVDTHMEELIEESREEWIETWLHATVEEVLPTSLVASR